MSMFTKTTIIGNGGMGSVCAMLLCENGLDVTMWGHDAAELEKIAAAKENVIFLPGYPLPESLNYEADDAAALAGADLVVSAVPCQFLRNVWTRLKPHLPEGIPIVSITKGIEIKTLLRPTQIIAEILGNNYPLATLSGPNIADELAQRLPASATVACENAALGQDIQQAFNTPMFRVYTNDDCVGVELAGAMKNVIAIAAGICDGLRLGDSARAALVTRGLAEITRLGMKLGGRVETFMGLSGLGDLTLTCAGDLSRNRRVGLSLATGKSLAEVLSGLGHVAEGVHTAREVHRMAQGLDVDMPITQSVVSVLDGKVSAAAAVDALLKRDPKAEGVD